MAQASRQASKRAQPNPKAKAEVALPQDDMDLGSFGNAATLAQLQATAKQYPRDEPEDILKQALAELRVDETRAREHYYAIPYKNHTKDAARGCKKGKGFTKKDALEDDCPVTWVEGCDVDAARVFQRLWGNCAVSSFVAHEIPDESTICRAIFIDFQSNTIKAEDLTVKHYNQWGNKKYDRDLTMEIAATLSKVYRNVILNSVPKWLKDAFFDEAKTLVAAQEKAAMAKASQGKKPVEEVIVAEFAKVGITQADIENFIGHGLDVKLSDDEIGKVRGLLQAIKANEAKPEDYRLEQPEEPVNRAPQSEEPAEGEPDLFTMGDAKAGQRADTPGGSTEKGVPESDAEPGATPEPQAAAPAAQDEGEFL
jgi:hypothetical protein